MTQRRNYHAERMEARICFGALYFDAQSTRFHLATDPTGKDCATCREAAAERKAAHQHAGHTYLDGVGVERFSCCYERTDGASE